MIELEEYEKNKSFILQFIRDEDDNELNNVLLTEIRKPILEEPEKENESINCEQKNCINFLKKISLKWVLIVTILACLVAYILMFYELPTAKEYMIFTKWLIITGQGLVAQNRWEIWLIFALIEVVLGLFCLPGKGGINMIEAFLAQQFMKVFLIAAQVPWATGILQYFIAKYYLEQWFLEKLKDKSWFVVISKEVKKAPFQTIMVAFLLPHPPGLTNYILPIVGLNFKHFWIGTLPFTCFFAALWVCVGLKMNNLNDLIDGGGGQPKPSWDEMSKSEKVLGILSWVLQAQAIFIFIAIIAWFRQKMIEYEKQEKKKEEYRESINVFTPLKFRNPEEQSNIDFGVDPLKEQRTNYLCASTTSPTPKSYKYSPFRQGKLSFQRQLSSISSLSKSQPVKKSLSKLDDVE